VFPLPDMRSCNSRIVAFIQSEFELVPCDYWGAVKISDEFMRCCDQFQQTIAEHLPDPMSVERRRSIKEFTANRKPNCPGSPNRDLRPVIHKAHIASPNAGASTVFLTGVPYAIDSYRQCVTPVYAILNTIDHDSTGRENVNTH
jgi:hypothetical protein